MELLSTFTGLALGAYVKVQQQKHATMALAIQRDKQEIDDRKDAREMSKGVPHIQWTKRVIALTLVTTWCLLHLGVDISALFHISSITHIGYTEITPKFLWFGEKEAVKWVAVIGPAITPAFSNSVLLMLGYYFGNGGTRP
jgi:hypothetical protein